MQVKNGEVILFRTPEALVSAAASSWLDEVEAATRRQAVHHVAFSGGRIARSFFSAALALARTRNTSFARVECFWADERCVPPGDAESNFRLAGELLLNRIQIPEKQVHRIRGEESPVIAAAHADAELCRIAPLNSNGHPVLDLILLGMGEDGHVASLFPGESESAALHSATYRAVAAPKFPPHRITLDYQTIMAARQVWVLVSGAGKQAALKESLLPAGQTPLALILAARPQTRILTDIETE
jgi:6-phosphogluconolactonase